MLWNTGSAASKSAFSPPTMMLSAASTAPFSPPDHRRVEHPHALRRQCLADLLRDEGGDGGHVE